MKLYALSLTCGRYESEIFHVVSIPFAVLASSEAEAVGKGIRFAMERWPQTEGWQQYQASPVEIPTEMIKAVAI